MPGTAIRRKQKHRSILLVSNGLLKLRSEIE